MINLEKTKQSTVGNSSIFDVEEMQDIESKVRLAIRLGKTHVKLDSISKTTISVLEKCGYIVKQCRVSVHVCGPLCDECAKSYFKISGW